MSDFQHSYALVIGINDYSHGITSLKTAVSDATEIAHLLETKHHYTVNLLVDRAATLSQLRQVLETELPKQIQEGDRFLFYFAGHGIALNGEDGPEGYLVPQNAKLGNVSTYLRMSEVNKALLQLPCRHFLGILDCCFAGAFRWSSTRKAIPIELGTIHKERYDRFIQDPAWQVLTSAAYDQFSWDAFDLKDDRGQKGVHSPFAGALIEALEGKADAFPPAEPGKPAGDGVITASELYLYLRDRVEIATEARAIRQTPGIHCLNKHDKGEYIFLTPGHALNLPPAPPLDVSKNPYRGLSPFEEEQCDLFFGRNALTQKLYEFVTSHTLTVVLGASGSGKSSLVKAGLIPKLRQCQDDTCFILPPFRPGESPFKALNKALASVNLPAIATPNQVTSSGLLTPAQSLANWFKEHPKANLLLVVDQFEELITLCRNDQERQQFLEALAEAITTYPHQLHLVLTLRSDFEPQFRNTSLEKYWQAARFSIPEMSREEFRQAIEEPACARVMYFDPPELVEQLIDEVINMPGALPLLSFALSELYLKYLKRQEDAKNRGETIDRAMTQADYEELGGVTRSLTQRAEQEYQSLVKQDPAYTQTIRHVMLRMVSVTGELARRRVPLSELEYPEPENTRVKRVIQCFSNSRLLTTSKNPEGQTYVEPAHDALVNGWQRILVWKNQQQESLLLQRRLTPAAMEWNNIKQDHNKTEPLLNFLDQGLDFTYNSWKNIKIISQRIFRKNLQDKDKNKLKKSRFLWDNNPRLNLLEEALNSPDNWLSKPETEFVKISIKQSRRNGATLITAVTVFISGLIVFSIIALIGQRNALVGQVNALRESSEASWTSNQELEALLAALQVGKKLKHPLLQVLKPNNELQSQVIENLYKVIYQTNEHNRLEGHEQLINEVIFSPDGKYVVTASDDRTARLWNLQGVQKRQLNHEYPVRIVRFSHNSKLLTTVSQIGIVRLWDLQGNKLAKFQSQHAVSDVEFHPQEKFLAIGLYEGISLWDLQGDLQSKRIVKLPYTSNFYTDVEFSPDGKLLAIDDIDKGIILLWDLQNSKTVKLIEGNTSKFASKDNILATSNDKTVSLRDLQGKEFAQLTHKDLVEEIEFSHDGNFLATVLSDGIVKLWDLREPDNFEDREPVELQHTSDISTVKFSSNSQLLAVASDDRTTHLWNLQGDKLGQFVHKDVVLDLDFSPDNKFLATASSDGTAHLWNLQGQELKRLNHQDTKAVFSSKAQFIATWSWKRSVHLWNLQNGKSIPLNHLDTVKSLRVSPNDNLIATVSSYDTVHIWNLQGQEWQLKHPEWVNELEFSPNGKLLATASDDNIVRVFNLDDRDNFDSQKPLKLDHPDGVDKLSFSPDSKRLVTASKDRKARVWNLHGDKLSRLELRHQNEISEVIFSPDGKFLATTDGLPDNGTAHLWNLQSQEKKEKKEKLFDLPLGFVAWLNLGFSPDGRWLAIVSSNSNDGSVSLWDLQGRKFLPKTLKQSFDAINDLRFSPKGNLLAMYSASNTAHLWNLEGNKQAHLPHSASVNDAQFSPNGNFLVTASDDGIVHLWNLQGQEITQLKHQAAVEEVRFTPDGQFLFTVSDDGTVWQWQMGGLDHLLSMVCKRVSDYLKNNIRVKDSDHALCNAVGNSSKP
jgi:WD40 repeat protein